MSRRNEIYTLVGLLVVLAAAVYYFFVSRTQVAGLPGVAADTKFEPLDVEEPQLRLDLLRKLQKLEYSGSHRNIFVAAPPPPPKPSGGENQPARIVGPMPPPPPPPPQVQAEFFGYASQPRAGRRVGFFTSGDDILVVSEGAVFLGRFRLVHIGNDSADVEEMSSGRHVMMQMVQPPDQAAN
jgi:hypothetical protein